MKVKANYRQLKTALNKVMKALKKSENRLIKIRAQNDSLSVAVNDAFGIEVTISAEVSIPGTVTTTEREVRNILFLPAWDNVLLTTDKGKNQINVKWGDAKDSTRVRLVEDEVFVCFRLPDKNTAKSCMIPAASFKSMAKDVLWICNDDGMSRLTYKNVVKISFAKENDHGIVSIMGTNGAAILKRKEIVRMEGSFIGEIEVAASQMHRILGVLEDEELEFVVDNGNLFIKQSGLFIDAKEILQGVMPNVNSILELKDKSFPITVNVKRDSLADALIAVKEWMHEDSSRFSLEFGKDILIAEVSEGDETVGSAMLAATTNGYKPQNYIRAGFNNVLFEKIISVYPDEILSIQCDTVKNPFWMCSGENGEYIYCILPLSEKCS